MASMESCQKNKIQKLKKSGFWSAYGYGPVVKNAVTKKTISLA